ncbi:MAG: 16S rRNA (cytosine(1402)-N(4))-methyltransferase RsmH [Acidobacteriota bacterium]|jgi:16S rRNA (cytosine1402-N4)-methyltransferase
MTAGDGPGPSPGHVPVMLSETLRLLDPPEGGVVVDATLGAGGHAAAILEAIGPTGRLIGIDRDPVALEEGRRRLGVDPRISRVHGDYRDLPRILAEQGVGPLDGVLADLGISSMQLDAPGRGFSFSRDEALDMRMDRTSGITAADWLAGQDEPSLRRVLREFGEEPRAGRIARALVRRRDRIGALRTTGELAETVRAAIPARRPTRIDPATRTFQAIRIAVNDELRDLEQFVEDAVDALRPGGRLAVISFHSLEDRPVKRALRRLAGECRCPPDLPACACGRVEKIRPLTRRPLRPSEEEVARNPRARSARLRGAERLPEEAAS